MYCPNDSNRDDCNYNENYRDDYNNKIFATVRPIKGMWQLARLYLISGLAGARRLWENQIFRGSSPSEPKYASGGDDVIELHIRLCH